MAPMDAPTAIVGDGQMGLVLADALAARGRASRLWGRSAVAIEALAATRQSPRRLPGFRLPDSVEVTCVAAALFEEVGLIVNAVPTQHIRAVWTAMAAAVPPGVPVVSVSKGIENETLLRPTQVIAEVTGDDPLDPARSLVALSGPTIAAELAEHKPATMVAACNDERVAMLTQELFATDWLRIYRHHDLVGVEVAGALKNVIALAAGMVDGLDLGANAKSALLARGLAEIARFGVAVGATIDTFFGIAGVGDLATTCFSPHGRNRSCGERLGRGDSLESILETTASVVEGVPTTRSVMRMAGQRGVDMPITSAVHEILFDGLSPRDAITSLMQREPKAESIR